jgi:hypothetical protein
VELPITVKEVGEEEIFNKIYIEVFVVEAENVPLLCGRNTMKQWRVVLDMDKDKMNIDIDEPKEIGCMFTTGGHLVVQLHQDSNWNTDDTVYYMKNEGDVESMDKIRKIHEVMNHKSENNMLHAYRNAGKLTDKHVVNTCKICQKHKKSQGKPKVELPKVTDFSQIVMLDLKQFEENNVIWMICSFTRFCQGVVVKDKSALSIVEALNSGWNWRFGFPSIGFWADNGPEFKNKEVN